MRTKATSIRLSDMTCAELADWLEKGPDPIAKESKKDARLRQSLNFPQEIRRLRLLGSTSARGWKSSLRSAAIVESAPVVKLVIGGGSPKRLNGPRFTKRAKEIAAANGMSLHRWTGGMAFFTRKEQGDALPSFQTEKTEQGTLIP